MTNPVNLLDSFALVGTQVVRLLAELHRAIRPNEAVQAHVEIKLTPAELPEGTAGPATFQVGVSLSCRGVLKEQPDQTVFTIECVLNAGYRQISGDPVPYEVFSTSHASLTRQLYPLIHHQLLPILSQLGLHHVRLPHDIVHTPKDEGPPPVVH